MNDVLDGRWHHVAVQRAVATGRLEIYVDGILRANETGPSGDISLPAGTTGINRRLVIGAEKHDLSNDFPSYEGLLDEVRLSSVRRYTTNPFTPATSPFTSDGSTAALYHFDGTGGQVCAATLEDSSANNLDADCPSTSTLPQYSADTPFGVTPTTTAPTTRPPRPPPRQRPPRCRPPPRRPRPCRHDDDHDDHHDQPPPPRPRRRCRPPPRPRRPRPRRPPPPPRRPRPCHHHHDHDAPANDHDDDDDHHHDDAPAHHHDDHGPATSGGQGGVQRHDPACGCSTRGLARPWPRCKRSRPGRRRERLCPSGRSTPRSTWP